MLRSTLESLFSGTVIPRLGALALCASAVGCGGSHVEPPQTTTEVAQGLVLKSDPGRPNALSGTFRQGERVLYIEMLRGPRTPEAIRQDPGAPQYEVDLRIADASGQVFYVQQGGGELMDPSWEQEMVAPHDEVDRAADWALVEQLDEALAQPGNAAALEEPERQALALTARGLSSLREDGVSAQDVDVTPDGPRAMSTMYRHVFRMYEGNILGGLGEHSATRILVYNDGTGALINSRSNCNHGRCWSDDSMTYSCGRTIRNYSSSLRPSQWCATGYDWNSNEGHNCHDDTRLQNRSWYHNTTYSTTSSTYQNYCVTNDSTYDTIYSPPCYP